MSDAQIPRAPAGLGRAGKRLWRSIHTGYEGFDPAELAMIECACRTADVCAKLAAVVEAEGVMATGSTGQTVTHPALAELRLQRKLATDLLRRVGLDDDLDELSPAQAREWKARRAARARWSA